jgi:alkylation response protein AidB-like acyl-CoA dehydrogenase
LLTLIVPIEYGGNGATWPTVLGAVREIAVADGSLAHLSATTTSDASGVMCGR